MVVKTKPRNMRKGDWRHRPSKRRFHAVWVYDREVERWALRMRATRQVAALGPFLSLMAVLDYQMGKYLEAISKNLFDEHPLMVRIRPDPITWKQQTVEIRMDPESIRHIMGDFDDE